MATIYWRGDVSAVSQVTTLTVTGTGSSSATLTVTINGKAVGVAVVNTQTDEATAALLYAALVASDVAEFNEFTWSYDEGNSPTVVTGTGATPGLPIVITGSTAGGQTVTPADTTDATGPNDVGAAANYVGGSLPTNGDDLVVTGTSSSLLYNLDALASVTLASITVDASFTGEIGLPLYNAAGGYREYRPRYLQSNGNPTVTIGQGVGGGSGRIFIDATGGTGTVTVVATGTRLAADVPAVNLHDLGSGAVVNVAGGDVGVAAEAGQTATVTTLRLPAADVAVPPAVHLGAGATVGTVDMDGGVVDSYAAVTTLGVTGGTWRQWSGMPTTVTVDGGTVVLRGTGTSTTATARGQPNRPAPVVDCSPDPRPRTFTDHTFTGGAVLRDPNKSVTFTNAGTWDRESLAASDLGARMTLTRS